MAPLSGDCCFILSIALCCDEGLEYTCSGEGLFWRSNGGFVCTGSGDEVLMKFPRADGGLEGIDLELSFLCNTPTSEGERFVEFI